MDNHPPTIPIRSRSARTANGAPAERPASFTHRLWKGWLWLTGPRPERFAADISGREQLRRARLISALLVLILLSICLLLPSALTVVQIWFPVAFLTVCGALVAVLNRWGRVIWSAVAYVASVDGAIIGFLLIKPKLGAGNLSDFDLFILAVLIGGMILPRQLIPLTGALHVLFIILIFTLKPHDDILIQEIQVNQGGQTYTALAGLLVLQVCGAGIAWLHAWSVERAIVRASRAEELAETQARLSQQTQEISEQKRRLEQGIHALQEVQARIANGEYNARVSLQENELLPLAVSFNIMAERLGRVERIEQEHRRLEGAVQQLLSAAHALTGGVAPALAHATGTAVDRLFPLLTRLHHLTTIITQSSGFAQDLRTVLQQQHERLSGIESGLVNALALAKALAHESGQLLIQEPRPMSGALRSPTKPGERALVQGHLRALFDEELNLLEQAGQKCAETRELNARCLQGMRILGQRLKEAG